VVVGVPGQIVKRSHPHHLGDAPDLNHTSLPDVVGLSLKQLLERVDALENRLNGHANTDSHVHAPQDNSWAGDDFSI
jgi:serine O-acetyltransferase